MRGRRKFYGRVLRVSNVHWRWHVLDGRQDVVAGGTYIGRKLGAVDHAKKQAKCLTDRAVKN